MNSLTHKSTRSVAYLLNLFELKLELPHEIIPGFIFRKSSDSERDFISKTMHHSSVYSYRSAIAHGNKIDFKLRNKKGGFEELNSLQDVFFFLNEFVRRQLRNAIIEPQLCQIGR